MNRTIVFILVALFGFSAYSQRGISYKPLDELLKKHVKENGLVNYKGLGAERAKLKSCLEMIEANPPQSSWTRNQELAYWINAYNAFTLELILKHYPVKSIKDIGSVIQVPYVNSPWDIKFINIGGKKHDLNNIEHGIIRKKFDEPRIHFVLVCAAISCPKLQNEAFFPGTLEAQLTSATKGFLSNPEKNELKGSRAKISKLFNWYRGDFTKKTTVVGFINQYSDTKLEKNARLEYKDYDWSLNEQ